MQSLVSFKPTVLITLLLWLQSFYKIKVIFNRHVKSAIGKSVIPPHTMHCHSRAPVEIIFYVICILWYTNYIKSAIISVWL